MSNQTEEVSIDLDNLKPTAHNWVDRGLIMSCEGANHPYHEVSKHNIGKK